MPPKRVKKSLLGRRTPLRLTPRSIRRLLKESLVLLLSDRRLPTSGMRQQLADRLRRSLGQASLSARVATRNQREQESPLSTNDHPPSRPRSRLVTPPGSTPWPTRTGSNASAGSSEHDESDSSEPSRNKKPSSRTSDSEDDRPDKGRPRHGCRHHPRTRHSSSESDTHRQRPHYHRHRSARSRPHHNSRKQLGCRRRSHLRHRSNSPPNSSITCTPSIPSHLRRKIRRGEYINFDKLLLSQPQPPLYRPAQRTKQRRKEPRRAVSDMASWLEAWNRFLCCHLSYYPSSALEMSKYQSIMVMLFSNHPSIHCLEYDRLFRQTAAQDTSIRWDAIKEDIYKCMSGL